MTEAVLILGTTGKIGRHSAHAFEKAGRRVRLFARHKDDMASAARGRDVIVNGLNPPRYHKGQELGPGVTPR